MGGYCKGICTRFLKQIKRQRPGWGPKGGVGQKGYLQSFDHRVYNFRVVYHVDLRMHLFDDYRTYVRCTTCGILYQGYRYNNIRNCICCSRLLTIRYHRGGRNTDYRLENDIRDFTRV
jgi:hypothetical protein